MTGRRVPNRREAERLRAIALTAVDASLKPTFESWPILAAFELSRYAAVTDITDVLTKLEQHVYVLACKDKKLTPQLDRVRPTRKGKR